MDNKIDMGTAETVTVQELKYLLASMFEQHANTCCIFCQCDEKWSQNYLRVLLVTEKGAIFNDEKTNKITSIKSIEEIVEFELDRPYYNFERKSRYKVSRQP